MKISRTTTLKEGTSSSKPSGDPPESEQRSVAGILAAAASRTATALRSYAFGAPAGEVSGTGEAEDVQQAIDRMRTGPIEEEPTAIAEEVATRTDAHGTPQAATVIPGPSTQSAFSGSRQLTGESLQVTTQTAEQRVAHRCCCDHRRQCPLM
jgi:hypothetical protein